jgi:hypothetical protein
MSKKRRVAQPHQRNGGGIIAGEMAASAIRSNLAGGWRLTLSQHLKA